MFVGTLPYVKSGSITMVLNLVSLLHLVALVGMGQSAIVG